MTEEIRNRQTAHQGTSAVPSGQHGITGDARCGAERTTPEINRDLYEDWYWSYADCQGLFPYGVTGPFDSTLLQDALSRRVLERVAWTSALAQKLA